MNIFYFTSSDSINIDNTHQSAQYSNITSYSEFVSLEVGDGIGAVDKSFKFTVKRENTWWFVSVLYGLSPVLILNNMQNGRVLILKSGLVEKLARSYAKSLYELNMKSKWPVLS